MVGPSVRGERRPRLIDGRTASRLYVLAFLIRAFVGLLVYALSLYADVTIVEDARFYEDMGYEVAQEWLSGKSVDFDAMPNGVQAARLLVTTIAAFYYATNGVRALPILLVAYSAVTALVPAYVYRITQELHATDAVAKRAGLLVALSPAFVFWSGSLYKEGVTLLVLSVAAYHTLRLQRGWNGRSVGILTLCVAALWGVRSYLAVTLAFAVGVSLFWGRLSRPGQAGNVPVLARQAVIVAVFAVGIVFVGLAVRADEVLLESDEGVLVNLDVRRAWSAKEARSGYLPDASVATPEEALQYAPLGLFYFLTVPLPWQIGAARQNMIIPENLFWLGLYPLMVVGIRRALNRNRAGAVFLLLMTGGMCIIYTLLVANVGTAYRMRSQVWLLLAPFAAWGWEAWHERRRAVRRGKLARVGARGRAD